MNERPTRDLQILSYVLGRLKFFKIGNVLKILVSGRKMKWKKNENFSASIILGSQSYDCLVIISDGLAF